MPKGVYIKTEEHRKKISEWQKGNKNGLGKHCSEENKKKLSILHKGVPLSIEHKKKLSIAHIKGGVTPIRKILQTKFEYRQWRSDVFTRDDFICQVCGVKGGRLNAHHIKSFYTIIQYYEITTYEEALECDELWNINNGITLCVECHKKYKVGDRYACNNC